MPDYQLTAKAVDDLGDIYDYTRDEFGAARAEAYLNGLDAIFVDLAESPGLAHRVDEIRKGYRRYLFQSHAIYFTETAGGILVVRVLHQRMRASFHLR